MPIDTAYNVQPVPEPRLDFSNILLRNNKEKHKAATNKKKKQKKKKKREKMRQKTGKVRRLAQRAIRQ